jgi:hypothetical protein
MEAIRIHKEFLSRNQKGRDHLEDAGIDGRIILKLILRKLYKRVWTGFNWHRIGTRGRLCDHLSSIKRREFLD